MPSPLAQKRCIPCRGDVPPLGEAEIEKLSPQIDSAWRVLERASAKHAVVKYLQRDYRFADFMQAMEAANRVASIAEAQQHHPDLHVAWGKLRVEIWTHKIGGLTESDFIFAAKCDEALSDAEQR